MLALVGGCHDGASLIHFHQWSPLECRDGRGWNGHLSVLRFRRPSGTRSFVHLTGGSLRSPPADFRCPCRGWERSVPKAPAFSGIGPKEVLLTFDGGVLGIVHYLPGEPGG